MLNTNTQPNFIYDQETEVDKSQEQNQNNESELILNTAVQRLFDDAVRRKELKERIQLLSAKRELEELR